MHIYQISVFLENRVGQLAEITSLLAKQNIDIRAISIAETSDYGIARLIVHDCSAAEAVLREHGDIFSRTPVWAVEVPDRPAGLSELLITLAEAHVDIAYMYSLFTHKAGHAYMVLRISNEDAFLHAMDQHQIKVVSPSDLGLK